MLIPTQKPQRFTKECKQLQTNGNAQKTHCQNGHEFNEENTYISPKSQKRSCRICTAAQVKSSRNSDPAFRQRATENMRLWRSVNKERENKAYTENRRRKKEWLDSQKLVCVRCGEADSDCLDFHHKDPSKKTLTLSIAIASASLNRIKKEVELCEVICSNCHRKLHAAERAATQ